MEQINQASALSDKLTGPIMAIVEKRRHDLMPMLQSGPAQAAQSALRDDECVRKVATLCYPLLPGLVRLAVKEAPFVNFVLAHREKLLAPLMPPSPTAMTPPPMP